jgi:penicillin-binding protein 1C
MRVSECIVGYQEVGDAKVAVGIPENFDGRFPGPISAEDALIRSRNVPAMWVSMQLKQPNRYGFLQSAGVSRLKLESYYGLALALGGGEVTEEELAGLYGMLANEGVLRPRRTTQSSQPPKTEESVRLLSPEAPFITLLCSAIRGPMRMGRRCCGAGGLEDANFLGIS